MDINKRLQFKLDDNGFISEFMNVGSEGILPDGIAVEIDVDNFDFDDFLENYRAYKFDGNNVNRDDEQAVIVKDENEKELLRVRRLKECFPIINRGDMWYKTLSEEQEKELNVWYKAWLDVTETKKVPKNPDWLK